MNIYSLRNTSNLIPYIYIVHSFKWIIYINKLCIIVFNIFNQCMWKALATSYTLPCKFDNPYIYIILSGVLLCVFVGRKMLHVSTLHVSVQFSNLSDPLLFTYGYFEIPWICSYKCPFLFSLMIFDFPVTNLHITL